MSKGRKELKDGQKWSAVGREFHTVGAAKAKDLRPLAEAVKGTARRRFSEDRRSFGGT